jgi:hypothetical protein
MKIVLKQWGWDTLLTQIAALLITILAPKPQAFYFGLWWIGFMIGNQINVLSENVAKKFRWLGGIIIVWTIIDFFRTGMSFSNTQSMYIKAFLFGYSCWAALGTYEPFALLRVVLKDKPLKFLRFKRERRRECFNHWGLLIALVSLVITALTSNALVMLLGAIIALIVKTIRKEHY